jgi:hypothetical protein
MEGRSKSKGGYRVLHGRNMGWARMINLHSQVYYVGLLSHLGQCAPGNKMTRVVVLKGTDYTLPFQLSLLALESPSPRLTYSYHQNKCSVADQLPFSLYTSLSYTF